MPGPNPEGGAGASSSVASGGAGSSSSAAPDDIYLYSPAICWTIIWMIRPIRGQLIVLIVD